jgi:hypothetical protein
MPEIRYTDTVGKKFYPDGRVRTHPGITIICFTDPKSEFYAAGQWVQEQFADLSFAAKYTMLPADSFHMTVFSLIIHELPHPDYWARELPVTATLEEADQFFIERVKRVERPGNFEMRFKTLGSSEGLSMTLVPANVATHDTLWRYRQRLVEFTGVRYPDHATYEFHMSFAYKIIQLTPEEEHQRLLFLQSASDHLRRTLGVFDTGAPYLTFFDDMFKFVKTDDRLTLPTRLAQK